MPVYRILYLKDSEVDRFRQAAPRDQPYKIWLRHYEEVGRIEAPGVYAVWKELQEGGAEQRGIRSLGVGDILEVEGEKPLLCTFWGFEGAEWRQPGESSGFEPRAAPAQVEAMANSGQDRP